MKRKRLCIFLTILALIHKYSSAHPSTNVQKCPRQCICDMRNDLRRATCNNQNIVDVNVGVPKDVQIYVLRGNVINEVDNYAFRDIQYASLVQLDLSNNLIFWVGLHAFAGLTKLRVLDLSVNRLQSLSADLFWYNKELESLDLSGNQFLQIKNEPFLIHSTLKVLNLSNSHIVFLPDLTFSKLPGLEVIDLSNNFMIELKITVFLPVHPLRKLNLKENPWHCNENFNKLEEWIAKKQVGYVKQCYGGGHQMFEKMILAVEPPREREDVDLNELWNLDDVDSTTPKISTMNNSNVSSSFYERFEERFPSVWALIVGFQLGLILGIVVTYFCLANLCKCRKITLPRTRRQLRRIRNMEEMETRTSLLWTTLIQANTDTPPIMRRQLSSPTNRGAYCRSSSWEILPTVNNDNNTFRFPGDLTPPNSERAETPPPPYQQCTVDNL